MFYAKKEIILQVILTGAIGVCSFIGDQCVKHGKSEAARAIFDNVTHGIVGGFTWAVILSLSRRSLIRNFISIFWSVFLSSFIDVDHVIAAGSWKFNDVTHLKKRPFLHCTTVPITLWCIINLYSSMFNELKYGYYSWLILASFLSHHIRDATRRGLWFCLIGSTQPIPYYLYLTMSMMLPHILHWLMMSFVHDLKSLENTTLIDIV